MKADRAQVAIRPFAPADFHPLVDLWNLCLPKDPISPERFWHLFLLDENFDPQGALVAEREGTLAGFMQAMVRKQPMPPLGLEGERGWITAFFVAPSCRRAGIASLLFEHALDFLRSRQRTEVWCNGYAPRYAFPGVDDDYADALSFLRARGFDEVAQPVAMGLALDEARTPDKVRQRAGELERQGFAVRPFDRGDTLPLIAFSEEHFPAYGDTIRDGLQHDNLEIVVATHRGEIVGFAQWENTSTDPPLGAPGRFGPFGVRPDLRNLGLGALIFYHLIDRVRAQGSRYLWFGWAGGRNLTFYERAGCVITRRFHLFRRSLEEAP